MCLGIPGQVIELTDEADLVRVDVNGVKRVVNAGLLEGGVMPGDWVLVHVGFAMSRISEADAAAELAFLRQLGEAFESEMDALRDHGAAPDRTRG